MLEKLRQMVGGKADRVAPRVAPGRRVYAVGDIHGRADLLIELRRRIVDDAGRHPGADKTIIYLGDYIDRGAGSKRVLDLLSASPLPGFRSVHLRGNHEDLLLRFLEDVSVAARWFSNGGDATLESYGVTADSRPPGSEDAAGLQRALEEGLPLSHRRFLRGLSLYHVEEDYLFVHAGLRPGIAPERQDAYDLMWIRDDFLDSRRDHGRVVVHGHTVNEDVEFRDNRIGIDTGAYFSGRLTCLVLEGAERTLIQTG